jgi:3'(2'), 5'-bisphosphate nucleotidase
MPAPTVEILNHPLVRTFLEIANCASKVILEVYEGAFSVEMKGPDDPVTSADKQANTLICDALRDAFPGCPIVAEESDPKVFGDFCHAPRVFFVDPVDGTREFVKRSGEFVVMLGCVEELRPSAGVIWSPTTGIHWAGVVGLGALKGDAEGNYSPISPRYLEAPTERRILVSRAHADDANEGLRHLLGGPHLVAMSSAGLKGAAVADGSADAYVSPRRAGKRWDACAPDAIVSAAGGIFSDSTGAPIDYRDKDLHNHLGLVASHPRQHSDLIAQLRNFDDRLP